MKDKLLLDKSLTRKGEKKGQWNLFNSMLYVPDSNLPGLRFFVHCIITICHSHLNDMEIHGTKRFIPKGFELGTSLS